jgi:hypothetical protein
MKAFEISTTTDNDGYLRMVYPLKQKEKKVKVIILFEDETVEEEEQIWLESLASNPAFDFLSSEEENVYSLKDG